MLDIQALLGDIGVNYWTSGKNVSDGWVSISCPACGDRSNHGAFGPNGFSYSCFRCGKHSAQKIIGLLTSFQEARTLVSEYTTALGFKEVAGIDRAAEVEWPPPGAVPMPSVHAQYLYKRGYDPRQLKELYGVECVYQTGDFKYRVVIPIYVNGRVVTYVGRDITDKAPLPYKNLAERKSILPVKETIYNIDNVHEVGIVCEGIFDAWRFGTYGLCTYGLQFTAIQTRIIATTLKKVFTFFDNERQAQAKAKELGASLCYQGVEVENIVHKGFNDPGEMPQHIAEEIKKELLF